MHVANNDQNLYLPTIAVSKIIRQTEGIYDKI